jgi:dihydroxyacetone kinase-like predicted kinase
MQAQFQDYLKERLEAEAQTAAQATVESPQLTEENIGVVVIASGNGIARVFRELGAAGLVMGGQTNNPSTQEIFDAIQNLPTRKIVVLPNNKNIILAAEQAARLATDQEVIVIPTRSMPQGISAMLPYDPEGDIEDIAEAMLAAKDDVSTGEITTATRTVELNGVNVGEGQIIGLVDGTLTSAGDNLSDVIRDVLQQMRVDERDLVTLYYGDHIQESDAKALMDELSEDYPDQEFELVYGGQPHYHYILSAE